MREEAVYRFLEIIGVPRERMQKSRQWVNAPCPLAPWMHSAGVDSRPSFGVSVSEEQRSVYFCFGCSPEPKRLEGLLHNLFLMRGYPHEAAAFFAHEENFTEPVEDVRVSVPDAWTVETVRMPGALPPSIFNLYPLLQWSQGLTANACRMYLENERKLARWACHSFGVRFDPKRRAVVFPLTDASGKIFVLRERSEEQKEMWTVNELVSGVPFNYPKLKDVGAWFGMHLVNWSKPVLLVEGEIDALRAATLGYANVIASATSSVTDAQLSALCGAVYWLGYDNDKAGAKAHSKIASYLTGKAHLFELDWSLVSRKDAGALKSSEELREVLSNAHTISS